MEELLTTEEAAALIKLKPQTLRVWREKKKGPPFVKAGDGPKARIRYRRGDIEEYLKALTQTFQ